MWKTITLLGINMYLLHVSVELSTTEFRWVLCYFTRFLYIQLKSNLTTGVHFILKVWRLYWRLTEGHVPMYLCTCVHYHVNHEMGILWIHWDLPGSILCGTCQMLWTQELFSFSFRTAGCQQVELMWSVPVVNVKANGDKWSLLFIQSVLLISLRVREEAAHHFHCPATYM